MACVTADLELCEIESTGMSFFKRERTIEIESVSGTVRVTVTPKRSLITMLPEAVAIGIFCVYLLRSRASIAPWWRALLAWAVVSSVIAWFYQLSGSEIIEFDAQKVTICKHVFGWTRASEYPVSDCQELQWREAKGEGDYDGLQGKVGWRTITFGSYISEDEAIEVLTALQSSLPDVAQQLCTMADSTKNHFTTLNLS